MTKIGIPNVVILLSSNVPENLGEGNILIFEQAGQQLAGGALSERRL